MWPLLLFHVSVCLFLVSGNIERKKLWEIEWKIEWQIEWEIEWKIEWEIEWGN